MSKSGLKQAMVDAMTGPTDSLTAFNALAAAINDYITNNLVIKGSYANVNPPLPVDLVPSVTCSVICQTVLGPSLMGAVANIPSPDAAILALGTAIQTGLLTALIGPDSTTLVTPTPLPILCLPVVIDMSSKPDSLDIAYGLIATAIDTALIIPNPTPAPSTHVASTGITTFTNQAWK